MVRTRVGYAGGSLASPIYTHLGDHSETIEIDYDPTRIGYDELLAVYWDSHAPYAPSGSRQYASRIFYHDDDQRKQAEASRKDHKAQSGRTVHTTIEPYDRFWLAEAYHQKYYLRYEEQVQSELHAIYPSEADYVNSTAVARANGYAGRWVGQEQAERELPLLGLSPVATERLNELVRR